MNWLIVRLGELTLKGRNRGGFEAKVREQVRGALREFPGAAVWDDFGRIYIETDERRISGIIDELVKIPGIETISPAVKCESELETILETALTVFRRAHRPGATFKASVRRADKRFPHESTWMQREVGAYILRHIEGIAVDVRNPQLELKVEIREEGTFVFWESVQGMGGFPYGTNGKAMLLLSGGIDSPVAGYCSIRQGLEVEAIHFHSYPYTSERAKQKVEELARKLAEYTGSITLHFVPFTDIQLYIRDRGQEKLWITLMRRTMLRIAEMGAEESGARGIVTGDSLGQVASQTLSSMNTIGRGTKLPLLRPLIMTSKREIVKTAVRIGTFDISNQPYDDCCTLFVPESPSTNPNVHIVDRIEASMEELQAMSAEAWANRETVIVQRGTSANEFASLL